ncbi:hypothetical protein [uncultured Tenacibaculum sp.]|uniref:hypothetical protein n=1 Tax=uncultured Tenacibaculum sp. TaxID=174713 RepID=UPI00262D80CE|nr:hypothetical protein [uncultured Tenacibaculum sp.]
MKESHLPIDLTNSSALKLKELIVSLENEINKIEKKLLPFEQLLRSAIADLLVEEREFVILYKQQKKAKKAKRLEQKRRGKNYKETTGLKVIQKQKISLDKENLKEKKRLYKEAMLYVHPDKFSMKEAEESLATEITTKLIEIYKTGTFEELQNYHSYIFSGNLTVKIGKNTVKTGANNDENEYLKSEVIRLEEQLNKLQNSYANKVLNEYKKPLLFVEELKKYYKDRIFKFKKRTRTK